MTSHAARRLATRIRREAVKSVQATPTARGADWRSAIVATVGTDGTITTADGILCRRMAGYAHPVIGDQVVISRSGNGNWRAEGTLVGATDTEWTAYTPAITNGGAATLGTADGWWKRSGTRIDVEAYLIIGTAGTGGSTVMVSLPSTPYRGAANRRQSVPGYLGAFSTGNGPCCALITAGGSGARIDQVQNVANGALTGASLTAGAIITIHGWYREA